MEKIIKKINEVIEVFSGKEMEHLEKGDKLDEMYYSGAKAGLFMAIDQIKRNEDNLKTKMIKIVPVSKIKLRYFQKCSNIFCQEKATFLIKMETRYKNFMNEISIIENKFWICDKHKGLHKEWEK